MSRKTRRRLLRLLSRVPGVYSFLAFVRIRRVVVSGWSMAPTLLPGDRILFDRLAYVRDQPRTGDVVLVAHPTQTGPPMVKRMAGTPGQTIDGVRLLTRGEYWVLGDSEGVSIDSREFGPVKRSELLGRAWLLYWPTKRWRVFSAETDSLSHRR